MIPADLYALELKDLFIKDLRKFPYKYYLKRKGAKMKFGKKQLDERGFIKYRIIHEPIDSLKSKQKKINGFLAKIALPNSMFGGVKGKSNISNALHHVNSNHFFTIDLKDFFTNTKDVMVNDALCLNGFSYQDAVAITDLCTLNGCLPQGAPSSSTLANIAFASTAKVLEDFCALRNIKFTVYVDDLTFSANYNFRKYTKQIIRIVRNGGYAPNNKKIRYRHTSCEITGLIIKGGRATFEKGMIERMDVPSVRAYVNNVKKQFHKA